jgi:cytochrome P450
MATADSSRAGIAQNVQGCPHAPLAERFDPFDLSDPFPLYAQARAEEPIFFSAAIGYWVVTRYDDIKAIFRDHETFSAEVTQTPYKPRPAAVQQVLDAAASLAARDSRAACRPITLGCGASSTRPSPRAASSRWIPTSAPRRCA